MFGNPQFKPVRNREKVWSSRLPANMPLSKDYDLGIKAIHFKGAIVKAMDIPDEVIPFVAGGDSSEKICNRAPGIRFIITGLSGISRLNGSWREDLVSQEDPQTV